MDLLGAYDSNSDSDNNDHGEKLQDQDNNKQTTRNSSMGGVEVVQADSTFSITTKPKSSAKKDKKRGKKILKLAAILPDYIWNQLTADTSGDGDSDKEEDTINGTKIEDMTVQPSTTKTTSTNFRQSRTTNNRKDSDLQKLLQELPKLKSASTGKAVSILGHGESDNADDNIIKEHVNTESTTKDINPDITASKTVPPPSQSSDSKALSVTSTFSSIQQPDYLPKPTASRTMPLVSAAPLLRHWERTTSVSTSYAPSHSIPDIHDKQSATSSTEGVATSSAGKKKMSRKRQMEQMLRAGKIHEFQGDYELEGAASVYEHSEYDSIPTYQGHGLRMVPTTSYNVSTGTTIASTEISGRQRNKHQLNSLLANAASLEARRMQNPHLGSGAIGGSGATHRASAKRKYGW